ncbi:ornithine cyclodeaminase family protein [Scleromatobacter humisilvae]|uniref:Ornithine cyclodeaminase family protein n=1 Tax=Scleromatobacter humisilvae TaxID=2897159 RepID=A0A9X1YF41_9BURK|nr:ornithine cyclodeaminase family protein [Scleromatobacter humisilvae]MCK9685199.1 ornithine cyclodeaminase family protein [Scleromatobacter humisilvae]
MKQFDAAATARALAFPALIDALERQFVAGCEVPARHVHAVGDALTALVMPAWVPGRYFGVKIVNVARGNAALGLPGIFASYQLFDASTGAPLALIDGGEITARRTAAASALAASRLAREDARRQLIVGAGRVGGLLAQAYRAVRRIDDVMVWSRDEQSALRLVVKLAAEGIPARVVTDLATAAATADIVSCATLANEPLIHGEWLAPGSHLDLIGGFTPAMREADDACFAGAEVWIDTADALAKAGDLLHPIEMGVLRRADVRGTLADLAATRSLARDPAARTVFKSVGTALEDLAAAILVYESR